MKPSSATHLTIARHPLRHLAFPDICRLTSGKLLVVYREGAEHVDPSGRIMLAQCPNPERELSFTSPMVVCETDLDDRDPSITQLADGTLLVNFFRLDPKTRRSALTIVRSVDSGRTWSDPWDLHLSGFPMGLATSDAILELPSGELVMAVYGQADDGREGSFLIRSPDRGESWSEVSPLAVSDAPVFEEPAIVLLPDGRLLALLRTDRRGLGFLYQTLSSDGGFTWSPPKRLNLWGYPADLLVLRDGRLLATYGYRQFPTGIRSCIAERSLQWVLAHEVVLRDDGHDDGELGYPASIQLDTGEIVTVYYFTDREGGMPYIAATRFRID